MRALVSYDITISQSSINGRCSLNCSAELYRCSTLTCMAIKTLGLRHMVCSHQNVYAGRERTKESIRPAAKPSMVYKMLYCAVPRWHTGRTEIAMTWEGMPLKHEECNQLSSVSLLTRNVHCTPQTRLPAPNGLVVKTLSICGSTA